MFLRTLLAEALPPARHPRRANREVMLEHDLATEALPVRVLAPPSPHPRRRAITCA
jgi:hypothetical protein